MTPHEPDYSVAHTIARLARIEDLSAPRQVAIAWLKKHYVDLTGVVEAFNRGWETAREGQSSRTFVFERFTAGCKAVEDLIRRTPGFGAIDIPPGGFNSYLFDWVAHTADRDREPLSDFRRPEGDGESGAEPSAPAPVRPEDQ